MLEVGLVLGVNSENVGKLGSKRSRLVRESPRNAGLSHMTREREEIPLTEFYHSIYDSQLVLIQFLERSDRIGKYTALYHPGSNGWFCWPDRNARKEEDICILKRKEKGEKA